MLLGKTKILYLTLYITYRTKCCIRLTFELFYILAINNSGPNVWELFSFFSH